MHLCHRHGASDTWLCAVLLVQCSLLSALICDRDDGRVACWCTATQAAAAQLLSSSLISSLVSPRLCPVQLLFSKHQLCSGHQLLIGAHPCACAARGHLHRHSGVRPTTNHGAATPLAQSIMAPPDCVVLRPDEGLSLANAYQLLRGARPAADPNTGFMRQLHAFSQALHTVGSSAMGSSAL